MFGMSRIGAVLAHAMPSSSALAASMSLDAEGQGRAALAAGLLDLGEAEIDPGDARS